MYRLCSKARHSTPHKSNTLRRPVHQEGMLDIDFSGAETLSRTIFLFSERRSQWKPTAGKSLLTSFSAILSNLRMSPYNPQYFHITNVRMAKCDSQIKVPHLVGYLF